MDRKRKNNQHINGKSKDLDSEASSLKKLEQRIAENPKDWNLYADRAKVYFQQNDLARALNDYEKVLSLDPEHKTAPVKIEMIRTILRYNNTDIYASPNTDMDPWLE